MGQSHFDTIVAPITGNQPAAVAWVRVSGPEAWRIASSVFDKWPAVPESHKAVFGTFVHGDVGLALPFAKNHSYTGDEAVELSVHGSPVSVRNLIETCIGNGARHAEPGEFTLRAFLNGRIDLTEAEAVKDTVEAQTDAQLRIANLNRKGLLKRRVSDIRSDLLKLLAKVEASVDFSDEIGELDRPGAITTLNALIDKLDRLIETADSGRLIRNGYRIAIVGPPNAGKSSLLNALLGEERSIVTDLPGTTRDYVEERLEVCGLPVVLVDTAGLRETYDPVESVGIQRTRALAANADAIWYLYDASVGWTDGDANSVKEFVRPVTVLANKRDIATAKTGVPISATTREGLESLTELIKEAFDSIGDEPLIDLRHQPLLAQARCSLYDCIDRMNENAPDDLLSVLLADGISHLGAVTGETAAIDMVERIFHDFCVGK